MQGGAQRWQLAAGWLPLLVICLLACGDDDNLAADAAADDSSAALHDAGDSGAPPPSAPGPSDDHVRECDRGDPSACRAGEDCHVVIRRAPDEVDFEIYTGCVERAAPRSLGAPCDPWGGLALPYAGQGLQDEIYVDPCEDGLFCAPDLHIRGAFTCQRACQSGRYDESVVRCPGADQYCVGSAPSGGPSPLQEVCRGGDDCEPGGGGCGEGRACFLRLNQPKTRVLTVCLPLIDAPLADGAACRAVNECAAGSACWGPPDQPPRGADEDRRCRRVCAPVDTSAQDVDGGADGEAAVPGRLDVCGDQRCVDLSEVGLEVEHLGAFHGQCG